MKNIDRIKKRIQNTDTYVIAEYLSNTWKCDEECLAKEFCEKLNSDVPCQDIIWKWLEEEEDG